MVHVKPTSRRISSMNIIKTFLLHRAERKKVKESQKQLLRECTRDAWMKVHDTQSRLTVIKIGS